MKPTQNYIAIGLSGLCAVLGLVLLILEGSARSQQSQVEALQAEYQSQQEIIGTGAAIQQQIIPNLFTDLSKFPDDVAIKALLSRHGYNPPAGK